MENLPTLVEIAPRHLVGLHIRTSMEANQTAELWKAFRIRLREIGAPPPQKLYSVQVFDPGASFAAFSPDSLFDKWAAIELDTDAVKPEGLDILILPAGLYAVFIHHGPAHSFPGTLQFIFGQWLPNSDYALDARPHFEIMDEHYHPLDPDAREEVWIPVRIKEK
ncbi:MAG: GyrI-like domain-containing protein [Saprospiraceae bacterium]|nr:GyrI-like domain-containing protein [Saprospiraceae bacterium]